MRNIEKASAAKRTAEPRIAFGVRIPQHLRDDIRDYADQQKRSSNEIAEHLFRQGFNMEAMTRGKHSAFMLDLFVAIRSEQGAMASRIMDVLDAYFTWPELSTAMEAVAVKHRR
jgi:hypothetical protein